MNQEINHLIQFRKATWVIRMNPAAFSDRSGVTKVSDLTKAEVAEIADTVYHEARHAQQYFRVARVKAGEGKTKAQIKTAVGIPLEVAKKAKDSPLTGDSEPNKKLIEEAKGWEYFTIGKYVKYKGEVGTLRDEINALRGVLKNTGVSVTNRISSGQAKVTVIENHLGDFFKKLQVKIVGTSEKDKFDESVLDHVKKIKKAFKDFSDEYNVQKGDSTKHDISKLKGLADKLHDERYAAYRDYEHEKDAWAVGGAVGSAVKAKT